MKKEKILVLSDLREFTQIVAKKALYIAKKYDKDIDVLHVEDESFSKFFKEKTQETLDKSKSKLEEIYDNKATVYCKCGKLIETIKEHIISNNISMIIVGFKRERTFFEDIFNGSNLGSIVRKLDLPILVVKSEDEFDYKNILIPTDLSKVSKRNIEYLASFFPNANYFIEHYYRTFYEESRSIYEFGDEEAKKFVDFNETQAKEELEKFVVELELSDSIKVNKQIKKFTDIKDLVDESIEYKTIDLLSLSIGTNLSIFSFDLLESSKKDVMIYKILED